MRDGQRVQTPDGPGRINRISADGRRAVVSVRAGNLRLVNEYVLRDLKELPESNVPIEISDDEARSLQIVLAMLDDTDIRRFVGDPALRDVDAVLHKLNSALGAPPSPARVRKRH